MTDLLDSFLGSVRTERVAHLQNKSDESANQARSFYGIRIAPLCTGVRKGNLLSATYYRDSNEDGKTDVAISINQKPPYRPERINAAGTCPGISPRFAVPTGDPPSGRHAILALVAAYKCSTRHSV